MIFSKRQWLAIAIIYVAGVLLFPVLFIGSISLGFGMGIMTIPTLVAIFLGALGRLHSYGAATVGLTIGFVAMIAVNGHQK